MSGMFRALRTFVTGPGSEVVPMLVSLSQRERNAGRNWCQKIVLRYLQRRFGVYISETAVIGEGVWMPHPVGIVIGTGVRIGRDCRIYQNVTIGRGSLAPEDIDAYPTLEDSVVVFAGAVVVGKILVGSGATVGANAVVNRDVPPGAVALGQPAVLRG